MAGDPPGSGVDKSFGEPAERPDARVMFAVTSGGEAQHAAKRATATPHVSRHPRIVLACWAIARAERRGVDTGYLPRRAALAAAPDPRLVDRGDGMVIVSHEVPVDGGVIGVTVYRAPGHDLRPAHVLLHGGAFCYGGPQDVDLIAREYATDAGCVVVTVAYRLAPEHSWPIPVEDAFTAVTWTVLHSVELGVDAERVSIGGVSAGGCVAAAVALMARDRGGPRLNFQLLEIPVLDLTMAIGTTLQRYATGRVVTTAHLAESYALYAPDETLRRHPYASPVHAMDLTGLPPTLVVTAQYDPLRDEGEEYARRLGASGVSVQVIRARGHVHSSVYSALPSAVRYRAAVGAVLARAHRDGVDGPTVVV